MNSACKTTGPRPFFFIGNKRSGTSHVVRMLNRLGGIYVCPEADIIWLLFQVSKGASIKCYPRDGDRGMLRTLRHCDDLLYSDSDCSVKSRFFDISLRLRDMSGQGDSRFQNPQWLGDKKPVQQADPDLRTFIYQHFADAKCLHLIRHPTAVTYSMAKQAQIMTWMKCWNLSMPQLLSMWVQHEKWVLEMKAENKLPILTVQYSDLILEPKRAFASILNFLELPISEMALNEVAKLTGTQGNSQYDQLSLPDSADEAHELIKRYRLRL